ncbi:hypothetical protein IFM89_036040 [Coptis chinensis]|uniref:Small acidic protein-like domain-containing protein n=1 Tax=Coptis chinensis TaxID=261450 RepID=A0A835HB43_9MAGN|nr:hypothetical protein IFM89_036040 [Coptis chinensis]
METFNLLDTCLLNQRRNTAGKQKNTAAEEAFISELQIATLLFKSLSFEKNVITYSYEERKEKVYKLVGVKGDLKADNDGNNLLRAEKQQELQMDLGKQYTAGLRRRDGCTVGLGLLCSLFFLVLSQLGSDNFDFQVLFV